MPRQQSLLSSSDATNSKDNSPQETPLNADEALLAALGYKQEFQREFTALEVRQPFRFGLG